MSKIVRQEPNEEIGNVIYRENPIQSEYSAPILIREMNTSAQAAASASKTLIRGANTPAQAATEPQGNTRNIRPGFR